MSKRSKRSKSEKIAHLERSIRSDKGCGYPASQGSLKDQRRGRHS